MSAAPGDREHRPARVAIVYPVPMPYTFPVLRLIAAADDIDLTVLYARRSLPARGAPPDAAAFGFPHRFLADAGRVFVGREVREIDLNPGLPWVLGRLDPQLVVVSGFVQPSALLGVAWAVIRRRPYGLWVESHDLTGHRGLRDSLRRAVVAPVVRCASLLLPSGEAAADSLARLGGDRRRMARFPHVPDPDVFHPRGRKAAAAALRGSFALAEETPVLVFVGRLVESKGVEFLLEAHRELHARTGAWLFVVGAGPLEQQLTAHGVPGVSFLGFQPPPEVASILRGADLAVAPSLTEPWGAFPLEAAACGCPVVASDVVPSAIELATSGAGRLVAPGDSRELGQVLIDLVADPSARHCMSQRAVEAASGYTPEQAARSFLAGVRASLR